MKTPRIRRTRDSMPSSAAFSAANLAALDLVERALQADQNIVDALILGELVRSCGTETIGARNSSRASRSGGATKITVSLIGEGFGVPDCAGSVACRASRRRPDRSGDVGHRAERGGAGFQRGLAAHDLVELLVELFLVEQLAAGGAVDLGAQLGDAVFIGVLHLGLARDQPGQDIVAEGEIGRGRGRPHAEHGHGADHDPEHDRTEPHLLAGMDEGVAVLRVARGSRGRARRAGGWTSGRGRGDGVGDTLNGDRNGTTSALPRRSETCSVRPN